MNNHYDHWRNVPMAQWPWANFSPAEWADSRSNRIYYVPDFMDRLQKLRTALGFALPITSGYRTPEHDDAIGGAGIHPLGQAADFNVWGKEAYHVLRYAAAFGFTGIGDKQHGPYRRRFIHLDDLEDSPEHPRPWKWSYK